MEVLPGGQDTAEIDEYYSQNQRSTYNSLDAIFQTIFWVSHSLGHEKVLHTVLDMFNNPLLHVHFQTQIFEQKRQKYWKSPNKKNM